MSIREIARRTGLSRNTVKKYLRAGEEAPRYARRASSSKLDPYADKLAIWLACKDIGQARNPPSCRSGIHLYAAASSGFAVIKLSEELMNLYPSDNGPLAPSDWTMSVEPGGIGEGAFYFADVKRADAIICRLVVAGGTSEEEARRLLAEKARLWIAEYLMRPHGGTTDFGSLEG